MDTRRKSDWVIKFIKSWAIPVSWVKSECESREIHYDGVNLKADERGV